MFATIPQIKRKIDMCEWRRIGHYNNNINSFKDISETKCVHFLVRSAEYWPPF